MHYTVCFGENTIFSKTYLPKGPLTSFAQIFLRFALQKLKLELWAKASLYVFTISFFSLYPVCHLAFAEQNINTQSRHGSGSAPVSTPIAPLQNATRSIIDQEGNLVILPQNPIRVISLAPNITELVFSLQAQSSLVGRSMHCDYPETALSLPSVGSYYRPNLEQVISLNPDLCLISADGTPAYLIEKLKEMGIPVFILNPQSFHGLAKSILLLGEVFNTPQKAEQLQMHLATRLEDIKQQANNKTIALGTQPKILIQLQLSPIFAAGHGTFLDEIITTLGGINPVLKGSLYPRLGIEDVLSMQPDVILAPLIYGEGKTMQTKEDIFFTFWQQYPYITAVAKKHVYIVPEHFTRATLRSLDALEAMFPLVYPNTVE